LDTYDYDGYYPYAKATPQHRLAAVAVDAGFALVTCYVGYIVWSLITWGNGQTPGKQLLKIRVYSSSTGVPATWGNMAIRQFLIPFAVSAVGYVLYFFALFAARFIDTFYYVSLIFSILIYVAAVTFQIVDACWIFKDGKLRRLTDRFAKTDVLNECISLR
jgi:uncharacterized RDD family membrane protein YckC